jgi:hypothetical protein
MGMDERSGKLLGYLGGWVTIAVGNNAGRHAAATGLSPAEFEAAVAHLCAAGLAYREPLDERVWRLGITDAGVAALATRQGAEEPPRRPWWRRRPGAG